MLRTPEHIVKIPQNYFQHLNIKDINNFNKNLKIYTTYATESSETTYANAKRKTIYSKLNDLSSFYSYFFEKKYLLSQKKITAQKYSKYSILYTGFSGEQIKFPLNMKENQCTHKIISNFKQNENI